MASAQDRKQLAKPPSVPSLSGASDVLGSNNTVSYAKAS